MMAARPRNHLYLLGQQVKIRSCPRNQIYTRYQTLERRPPGRRLRLGPPWKHYGSKRERSPSYRFVNWCLRCPLLPVPLDRDHRINSGRDPAAKGELSNIDRDNIQYRPLFGHEHELGDPDGQTQGRSVRSRLWIVSSSDTQRPTQPSSLQPAIASPLNHRGRGALAVGTAGRAVDRTRECVAAAHRFGCGKHNVI